MPCLAETKPPKGDDWVYEIKLDGYRLSVHIEPKGIRILRCGGHDWAHRFPAIKQAAMWLPVGTAILDGETAVLNEQGRSCFSLLQQSRGGGAQEELERRHLHGLQTISTPMISGARSWTRRHLLEVFVPASEQGHISLSEEIEADGDQLLASAWAHGLEGIIGKRRSEPLDPAARRLGEDEMRPG